MKFFAIIFSLLFLFSCKSETGKEKNQTLKKSSDTNLLAKKNSASYDKNDFKLIDDSVEIPAFEIEIILSTKAEEKLKANKETIIINAAFSGIPKDKTLKEYKKWGEIGIKSCERELFDKRIAKFEGIKFSKSLYNSLSDKNISLLINVYSGRRSSDNNLLDCDILQDKMSEVKGKRFTIKGKLIGEPGEF